MSKFPPPDPPVKTSPLGPYVKAARTSDDPSYVADPFGSGVTAATTPILNSKSLNRILIFPGFFNPPHVGHYELLRFTMLRFARPLGIIGAIIIPMSEKWLKDRLSNEVRPVVLSTSARRAQWNGHKCDSNTKTPESWYYVYESAADDVELDWETFQSNLKQLTAADGFTINFISLFGVESLKINENPAPRWGCNEVVYADFGQDSILRPQGANGPLIQLPGSSEWRTFEFIQPYAQRRAQIHARQVLETVFKIPTTAPAKMVEPYQPFLSNLESVLLQPLTTDLSAQTFICHNADYYNNANPNPATTYDIYYLRLPDGNSPCTRTRGSDSLSNSTSISAAIRQVASSEPGDYWWWRVKDLVMFPELLTEGLVDVMFPGISRSKIEGAREGLVRRLCGDNEDDYEEIMGLNDEDEDGDEEGDRDDAMNI